MGGKQSVPPISGILLESAPKELWHEVIGGSHYFDVIARAIESVLPQAAWKLFPLSIPFKIATNPLFINST
jgi:hypothetical protein